MVCRRWHDKMRRSMRDSRERKGSEIKREEEDRQSEIAEGHLTIAMKCYH